MTLAKSITDDPRAAANVGGGPPEVAAPILPPYLYTEFVELVDVDVFSRRRTSTKCVRLGVYESVAIIDRYPDSWLTF